MTHSKSKSKNFRADAVKRKAKAQAKDNQQFAKETELIIKKLKGASCLKD
jgi:hypothetical protein